MWVEKLSRIVIFVTDKQCSVSFPTKDGREAEGTREERETKNIGLGVKCVYVLQLLIGCLSSLLLIFQFFCNCFLYLILEDRSLEHFSLSSNYVLAKWYWLPEKNIPFLFQFLNSYSKFSSIWVFIFFSFTFLWNFLYNIFYYTLLPSPPPYPPYLKFSLCLFCVGRGVYVCEETTKHKKRKSNKQ